MESLIAIAQLVLFAVFAIAGVAKLVDPAGFRNGLAGFGVPFGLHRPTAAALPWVELAVAALLLLPATVWWAGLAALLCLSAFTTLIGLHLAQGRRPSCNCFGQASPQPISGNSLLRNGALIACSLLIVSFGPSHEYSGPVAWWQAFATEFDVASSLIGVLLVLAMLSGWVVFGLLRQQGRLMLRIDNLELRIEAAGIGPAVPAAPTSMGLPLGQPAPGFALPQLDGGQLSLDALRAAGKPLVLVFSDPQCGPCTALLPQLSAWQRQHGDDLTLVLVSRGMADDNRAKIGTLRMNHVVLQADREVANAYLAQVTPSAVRIDRDGTIGSSLALGELDIAALVQETAASSRPADDVLSQSFVATNGRLA